jgi:hypothetical protein
MMMDDKKYFGLVAEICSAALGNPAVNRNFQDSANTVAAWNETLIRLNGCMAKADPKPVEKQPESDFWKVGNAP